MDRRANGPHGPRPASGGKLPDRGVEGGEREVRGLPDEHWTIHERRAESRSDGTGMHMTGSPEAAAPRTSDRQTSGPGESEPEEVLLEQVKALMLRLAAGQRFERLGAIVQEHLFTGGKRLRARLALDAVRSLGGDPEMGVAWAAACELLHNATLVHDDLQDSDPIRRGHFTVWMRHGRPQAINAGDLLLMLPFVAIEHVPADDGVRWHLARAVARRAEETVRGQSLEMSLLSGGQWDWEAYAEAARGKTSALMTLPVHGAALLCERSPERSQQLSDAFRDVGLLFQIQDDVVDLFGDKGRGERGGDLKEGRVSALVAAHLEREPNDTAWLVATLSRPREETTDRDIEEVAQRFERAGTLDAVLARIDQLQAGTREALADEPSILEVAERLMKLSLRPIDHLMQARNRPEES